MKKLLSLVMTLLLILSVAACSEPQNAEGDDAKSAPANNVSEEQDKDGVYTKMLTVTKEVNVTDSGENAATVEFQILAAYSQKEGREELISLEPFDLYVKSSIVPMRLYHVEMSVQPTEDIKSGDEVTYAFAANIQTKKGVKPDSDNGKLLKDAGFSVTDDENIHNRVISDTGELKL